MTDRDRVRIDQNLNRVQDTSCVSHAVSPIPVHVEGGCRRRLHAGVDPVTLQIDDAGVGDLLDGVVVGVYRPETGEFSYDMIGVEFFQPPKFSKKDYLRKASEIVTKIIDKIKPLENEPILVCSSFILESAVRDLRERYGNERVTISKITSEAQRLVETAYLDELRNLGYEPVDEREEKRARSFFHMLRWVKKDPSRFRYAKTGWPRLSRYVKAGRVRRFPRGRLDSGHEPSQRI